MHISAQGLSSPSKVSAHIFPIQVWSCYSFCNSPHQSSFLNKEVRGFKPYIQALQIHSEEVSLLIDTPP